MIARKPRKKRSAVARAPKASISSISEKLDRLEGKIDKIRRLQEDTEEDVEESLEAAEETEKDVQGIERDVDKIEKNLDVVEENVLKLSKFTIGKRHFTELARGTAGAFIGVSVGMGLRWMPIFAENMEWIHVVAVLGFIFGLGAMLLFKTEKDWVKKEGNIFVIKRLVQLYVISLVVVLIALVLFNMIPDDPYMLIKTIIVGSYPAMSGAITFTIT